jgi:hypothetical protein
MKLRLTYELSISEQNLPLIGLVAKMNGCNEEDPMAFVADMMKRDNNGYVEAKVSVAMLNYYGLSQKEMIESVLAQLRENSTCAVEFINEPVVETPESENGNVNP